MPKGDVIHELCCQIAKAGLPEPELEYMFSPTVDGRHVRRWRFDLAWPEHMLALEVEGSIFTGGRHGGRGSTAKDIEKYNAAALLGWKVIRFDTVRAKNGESMRWLRAAFSEGPLPI